MIRKAVIISSLIALFIPWTQVLGQSDFLYDRQYPGTDYLDTPLTDRVSLLGQKIESGEVILEHQAARGYLDSMLEALEIDPSSQVLVFSKTALKSRFVNAETPRAIYFNDDTYVGFIQNTRGLEFATMDPQVGPVFFGFSQLPEDNQEFERETGRCLRCHDSYSMTGGGVPRFLLSSVIAGPDGNIVTHEVSEITDTSTPLSRRWGGWYVTGLHGEQTTLGNFVVSDVSMLRSPDLAANGNKTSLEDLVDTGPYLADTSDIVALLVLEHQVELQNALTRLMFETKTRLHEKGALTGVELDELTLPVLESLFMVNEAALESPVEGSSGYTEYFQSLGPFDSQGNTLRKLDLQTRTFRYPFSYQIYSGAFDALPEVVKSYLFDRIDKILQGQDPFSEKVVMSAEERKTVRQILQETHQGFSG